MNERHFDVVVVGARCAGAALSTFLARSGARVLMVDRSPLPSDQILSTHNIHPPGMDILDELGVGDAVRSEAPPTRTIRLRKNDAWADVSFADGRAAFCPRRMRLDGLLQQAAVGAGAELRDRTRVTHVLLEDGRATGVQMERGGASETVKADILVGADGRHSFVARAVQAGEYLAYGAPRGMYWAYWDAPRAWTGDAYPFGMYVGHIGDAIRFVFQTDHGQLVVGTLPTLPVAGPWHQDMTAALRSDLACDPVIGPLLDGATPESYVRATLKERYFFRRAAGPGWALVGDAGHHKEFVIGDGITEALIQAKHLARAIADDGEDALTHWWRVRDVEALPGYHWGRDEGATGAPSELETAAIARLGRDDRLRNRIARLPEHQSSPYDVVPIGTAVTIVMAALARGQYGVVPDFIAQARRMLVYRRVFRQWMRLADASKAGREKRSDKFDWNESGPRQAGPSASEGEHHG